MSAHTPGEWVVQWDGSRPAYVRSGSVKIADITPRRMSMHKMVGPEDPVADARLIAAAPELLGALWDLVDAIESSPFSRNKTRIQAEDAARAAIAKARGEK